MTATPAWVISVGVSAAVSLLLWAGLALYVHRFATMQAELLRQLTAHQIDTANAVRSLTHEVRALHGMAQTTNPDRHLLETVGGAAGQDGPPPGHARGLD